MIEQMIERVWKDLPCRGITKSRLTMGYIKYHIEPVAYPQFFSINVYANDINNYLEIELSELDEGAFYQETINLDNARMDELIIWYETNSFRLVSEYMDHVTAMCDEEFMESWEPLSVEAGFDENLARVMAQIANDSTLIGEQQLFEWKKAIDDLHPPRDFLSRLANYIGSATLQDQNYEVALNYDKEQETDIPIVIDTKATEGAIHWTDFANYLRRFPSVYASQELHHYRYLSSVPGNVEPLDTYQFQPLCHTMIRHVGYLMSYCYNTVYVDRSMTSDMEIGQIVPAWFGVLYNRHGDAFFMFQVDVSDMGAKAQGLFHLFDKAYVDINGCSFHSMKGVGVEMWPSLLEQHDI